MEGDCVAVALDDAIETSSVRKVEDLRHRGGDEGLSQKVEPSPSQQANDPLKWFGVLVPNSLRMGQKNFIKGADY